MYIFVGTPQRDLGNMSSIFENMQCSLRVRESLHSYLRLRLWSHIKNNRYVERVIFKIICMLQVCIMLANISTCKSFDLITSAKRLNRFNNE